MNWGRVLLLSFLAGAYTGVVMLIPALKDSSFQDIGILEDRWVVLALLIVSNCEKPTEAGAKCFVFFLLSQPLVYLVEILFGSLTPALALTYYKNTWLPMTILTLPGGALAWYAKKDSVFGALVLSVGNLIQLLLGLYYAISAFISFPHHLYSALFCFASMGILSFTLQRERKRRMLALLLPVALAVILLAFAKSRGLYLVPGVF